MQIFNCLEKNASLFGLRFLEASAGTGKTFAIEHLFARLLLEAPLGEEPLQIEEILVITFTRAAALELKMRIRQNLEQANRGASWQYLQKDPLSVERIQQATHLFDRAQIFTIHGFCSQALKECTFGGIGEQGEIPPEFFFLSPLFSFLETQQALCPEQIGALLKGFSLESLCDKLLFSSCLKPNHRTFTEDLCAWKAAWKEWRGPPFCKKGLLEDFIQIQSHYKRGRIKGDFEGQIASLDEEEKSFRKLLFEKGSLFSLLSSENKKVKAKPEQLSLLYPGFFEWGAKTLLPLIEKAMDGRSLFERLHTAWQKPFEEVLEKNNLCTPDQLLCRMEEALRNRDFQSFLQQKYRAVIVDEFQDTDALQWKIFQSLVSNQRAFYLVGDPKQSIYRFRNADLYTYFQAREVFGSSSLFHLDTNFRSSPSLLSAINYLFGDSQGKPWLWLPKQNRCESYLPVNAGSLDKSSFSDEKGSLHFFAVTNLKESAFSWIAKEIQNLESQVASLRSFAILVKSRDQGREIVEFLRTLHIPAIARSSSALCESLAFYAIRDLFEAVFFPRDESRLKIFLLSGLGNESSFVAYEEQAVLWIAFLMELRSELKTGGIISFFRAFLESKPPFDSLSFYEKIVARGSLFYRDFFQILEKLIALKVSRYEQIQRALREWTHSNPDGDPSLRRRTENEDAVQVLTMHVSKGLEFEVVFALGVSGTTPACAKEELEELQAEKLRQLYVALTRAKKRLYIPFFLETSPKSGTESPLELFWQRSKLGSTPESIVTRLACHPAITWESISSTSFSEVKLKRSASCEPVIFEPRAEVNFPIQKGQIYSYSALVQKQVLRKEPLKQSIDPSFTLHTLPRGKEVGNSIHRFLETSLLKSSLEDALQSVEPLIEQSELRDWKESLLFFMQEILSIPLFNSKCLWQIDPREKRMEMEFFFRQSPHFLKGFMDLVVHQEGDFYLIDWKTNWLGETDDAYQESGLRQAMDENNYWLQASLYKEALQRAFPGSTLKKAFYVFVRGINGSNRGILSFSPIKLSEGALWNS